jgi:hypothetical protein
VSKENDMTTVRIFHPLEGLLPDGANFPSAVENLIQRLRNRCGIAPLEGDLTRRSLSRIDACLRGQDRDAVAKDPELFSELVAYVGEVARREVKGEWEMRDSSVFPGTWEPYIVTDGRGEVQIAHLILDALTEYEDASMADVVSYVTGRE